MQPVVGGFGEYVIFVPGGQVGVEPALTRVAEIAWRSIRFAIDPKTTRLTQHLDRLEI